MTDPAPGRAEPRCPPPGFFCSYALLVLGSPVSGGANRNALGFAEALLARGHRLLRVFFLDEGVSTGLVTAITPQAERDLVARWAELAAGADTELVVCISSALRRGVLDTGEARRHEREVATLHPAFSIGGLGLLVDAALEADRVLTFGG